MKKGRRKVRKGKRKVGKMIQKFRMLRRERRRRGRRRKGKRRKGRRRGRKMLMQKPDKCKISFKFCHKVAFFYMPYGSDSYPSQFTLFLYSEYVSLSYEDIFFYNSSFISQEQ